MAPARTTDALGVVGVGDGDGVIDVDGGGRVGVGVLDDDVGGSLNVIGSASAGSVGGGNADGFALDRAVDGCPELRDVAQAAATVIAITPIANAAPLLCEARWPIEARVRT